MQRRGTFNGLAMAAPSFTAFAMALVAVAGSARSAPDSAGESAMSVPASALWANACTYCHDTGVAPPIFGRGLRPETIAAVVRNGLNGMPAFHPSEISDERLALFADWVARQPGAIAKP